METDIYRNVEQENKKSALFYHHARPFGHFPYGIVKQERAIDSDFEGAYRWLEKEVGFYPLFLAVGATEQDIRMTGYQNQWRKLLAYGKGLLHTRRV